MPSWETLLAFATVTLLIAYFPGPALLYTAAQTIAHGRKAGLMAMLGIHLGCYLHVIAAAFGLSAVFKHVPELYVAVKIVGALYLVWLGIGMIRSKLGSADVQAVAPAKTIRRALIDSFIVEVLNPKVALFFIALLPQFVDPTAALPVWAQFLILGTIVNFAFSSADLITVLAASLVMKTMKASRAGFALGRWLGGSLMIGLGLKLATDKG
ncbi:Amino acid transporter [Bosea sp. 62]|uniref:LysE family translocator n=1 Tax=unclassified Bosea (in: a-proteobacteria) TaxID=2653178 RepID=UPI0012591560|nr:MULTISPECIES: LysE family translocator [unclassified Bosea (in: a-proteobacteria)]CAD5266659.1 Amino acid transporter [Bosea sp. 46]CAD5268179.1 Amino acid transporter [Bosea sp. 21B]CAD5270472.1 Amino acid transporter [Bosea sp. 7B]VVT62373.1 Threonine/homoserine/homoserine lactone efflux protein [Bosea sp. EC-HK365B]VXB90139.1 Amino acid transporter [Bosea sp. 29B]